MNYKEQTNTVWLLENVSNRPPMQVESVLLSDPTPVEFGVETSVTKHWYIAALKKKPDMPNIATVSSSDYEKNDFFVPSNATLFTNLFVTNSTSSKSLPVGSSSQPTKKSPFELNHGRLMALPLDLNNLNTQHLRLVMRSMLFGLTLHH